MILRYTTTLRSLRVAFAIGVTVFAFGLSGVTLAAEKILLAEGLDNPESAVVGDDGRIYVTITGKPDAEDDGQVVAIENGKATVIAKGMNDPRGIGRKGKELFVADKKKVWRIDAAGEASVFVDTDGFPVKPFFLNDIEVGPEGDVFVSESGTFVANGAVYRIRPNKEVSIVTDTKAAPGLKGPNGLLADGKDHLLLADVASGRLYRVEIANGAATELAPGLGGADGVVKDAKGRIYIGDVRGGRVFRINEPGAKPEVFAEGFKSAADIVLDDKGRILVPDSKAGTLTAIPIVD
ncbi:MAG TPA: SMP-30/gluconolactonase/LRE family protein [Pirellulales bacterium]|jgi:sugar lactone lactonase YvrE